MDTWELRMTGTDDGFDDFAAAAWPSLVRSAYLLTGDRQLAEDLTQTVLARTFARWSKVRRQDALAYARRALVNLNIDRMRRRRPVEVGGDRADRALDSLAERSDPSRAAEDRDEVVRLLARLTTRERRVVVLRHYFDLSEADVADELDIAPGTVKSTLARALTKLRVSDHTIEETVNR